MIRYDFTGRRAIVTGGTRGIGAAVTKALLSAGAEVTAVYASNDAAAQAFAEGIAEHAESLQTVKCDVGDYDAVERFFCEYDKTHEALDILVHCAGIRRDGVVAMLPKESWESVLAVDLGGTFNMFKHGVQRMLRQRYGRLVAISSISGRIGIEGQGNYAAAKAGQVALVKSMAKEVAKRKITVNCISPGFIDTDFISSLPEEQRKEYIADVPAKRFGTAEEVASAALFLASEEAAYITGTVLEIGGGL
ncbi:MAG: SDR family oxidoreductase [Victivallales bacterium]|nr:SDR family oxidoreductase [Victivallales bacterium]